MSGITSLTLPSLIASNKADPITEAGGLCSSLYLFPSLSDFLPSSAYSNLLDLYLNGAATFIKPLVA